MLLRASGTEPLVRVMVEAEDEAAATPSAAGERSGAAGSSPRPSVPSERRRPRSGPSVDARSLDAMCGIIGATGGGEVLDLLLARSRAPRIPGLRLGRAWPSQSGGDLWRARAATGTRSLEDLRKVVEDGPSAVTAGIGHTRWATHGHPTEVNAHPILDCTGDVAVVHNGIIENWRELAAAAARRAATSSSPTPTPRSSPTWSRRSCRAGRRWPTPCGPRCARSAAPSPWPSCAAGEPGTIVAGRRVSPLVIGMGDGDGRARRLLASDIPALLGRTRRFWVLDDDQVVELRPGSMRVTTLQGKEVEPNELHVDWDLEAAEKGGYPDFMGKEIHEQPRAVADTLLGRLLPDGTIELDELRITDDELRQVDKVFVVACGSSYHAGMVAKYAIERLGPPAHRDRHRLGVPLPRPGARRAHPGGRGEPVGRDHRHPPGHARGPPVGRQGPRHLQRGRLVDGPRGRRRALHPRRPRGRRGRHQDAPDPDGGARAAGALPGPAARDFAGPPTPARSSPIWPSSPGSCETTLSPEREADVAAVAAKFIDTRDFFFLGRHVGFPVALEGALKLKEISYVRAEGYPAGELKHGPIALIEPGTVVVGVATRTHLWDKMMGNVAEVRARGATVVLVANEGDDDTAAAGRRGPVGPEDRTRCSRPCSTSCPCSCFAYHIARLHGHNVDRPRNLAKTVTVE